MHGSSAVELTNDFDIIKLASDLLKWTFDLVRTGPEVFRKEVEDYRFYAETRRPQYAANLTAGHQLFAYWSRT
jgi:hypothetical protein